MANVIKDITVNWSWSGDTYAIDGFNVAVTPSTDNPKTSITTITFAAGNVTTYKFRDVTLDTTLTYTAWVQAVYDGGDSQWVSAGNLTVTDDGTATVATKSQVDAINSTLSDIANDNKLTPGEKSDILKEWNLITGEKTNIDSQATLYSITTEKTTYDNAYTALANYLNGGTTFSSGTPLWISTDATNGMSVTTDLGSSGGNTFRTNFTTYYNARAALQTKINNAAKSYVDNLQVGGRNLLKTADYFGIYNNFSASGTTATIVTDPSTYMGQPVYKLTMTPDATHVSSFQSNLDSHGLMTKNTKTFYANTKYTMSVYWKPISNTDMVVGLTASNIGGWTDISTTNVGGGWYRSVASRDGTVTTDKTDNVFFSFRSPTAASGVAITSYWTCPKIEIGAKATDWTPAPEDIDAATAAAQTSATVANALLSDIANDNKLTAAEKQDTLREWNTIAAEKANIVAQAGTFSVSTTAYTTAFQALADYLNGGTSWTSGDPLWMSGTTVPASSPSVTYLNSTTDITGTVFRQKFSDYYTARTNLLKATSDASKTYTDAVQVGGKNLFKNTGYSYATSSDFWSFYNASNAGVTTDSTTASGKNMKVTTTASGGGTYQRYKGDKTNANQGVFTSGQLYMLTCKIKVDSGAAVTAMNVSFEGSTYSKSVTLTSSWQTVTLPFTGDGSHYTITWYLQGVGSFYLADIKVEEGNRATTWSPAPEDSDASVAQVRTDLQMTAALPTSLAMNGNGITATTTSDSTAYARMDYRGLYIAKGAVQIDAGSGGVQLSGANGMTVTSSKNTVKMNATDGIKITRTSDNHDVFNVDTNGNLVLEGSIAMKAGSTMSWAGSTSTYALDKIMGARTENLVTNGNGYLGDNTNFTSTYLTYSKADVPSGAYGAFSYTGTGRSLFSDEIIPIDPTQAYMVSAMIKSSDATLKMSLGFAPYDIDGNLIIDDNYLYLAGSLTTLAQDLKPGDTTVYLASAAGWDNTTSSTDNTQRRLMFWDWTDGTGYTWPTETYTRHISADGAWDDSGLNKTANTITLKSAWSGALVPSGTSVSQGWSGYYYMYTALSSKVITTSWNYYNGVASGIVADGLSHTDQFPPGTRGVKVYFASSSTASATVKLANISVTATVRQTDFTGANVASMITSDDNGLTLLSQNINLNGRVTFNSIDPTDDLYSLFTMADDGSTVIDGSKIKTGTIVANEADFYGLSIYSKKLDTDGVTLVPDKQVFTVDDVGNVNIMGTVQSLNYISKSSGWMIGSDGTAEFNGATFRGNVEVGYVSGGTYVANAGIYTAGTSSREIRFWAGGTGPTDAPFQVYSNGDLVAQQGTFTGTFSGKVSVGNITIEDDAGTGNSATFIMADNSNNPKISLSETDAIFYTKATFGSSSSNFFVIDSTNKKLTIGSSGDMYIDYGANYFKMKDYTIASADNTTPLTFTSTASGTDDFKFTNSQGDVSIQIDGALKVNNSILINSQVTMRKALNASGNAIGVDFVFN